MSLILCILLAVSDGDTIVCRTDKGVERVRVAYLDCPELGQANGYSASMAMAKLLRKPIELKPRAQTNWQPNKCKRLGYCDVHGRTVASVYARHRDVARRLIVSGNCKEFCRFSGNKYGTCQ